VPSPRVDEVLAGVVHEAAPASPRRTWIAAALVALLVGAMAFTAGVLTARPSWPAEDSADAGFARDMSAHHAQAVSMGIEEHGTSGDSELSTIAVDIALTQQAQIGKMQSWLLTWGLPLHTEAAPMAWMPGGAEALKDGLMPGMASQTQMTEFREAKGRAKDIMFCELMINHHLGGIHMVDGALSSAQDEQLLELARQIKAGQQYEIKVLQDQLARLKAS
jgi:uncharacterized protein (DUF305 family)